ncbi:MAG TPA: hypothetical protein VHF50_07785 [Solirubrobacterales bacterium]|nr:hypothetical protein [Solirubrobacterales bacterium]
MFSSFRNRFGIPGVISVIALVFAMLGGAYAANDSGGDGSKASASAKAKKGPRGPRGPKGPAGPQGPAGAAGAKGDTGAAGANGANGKDGAPGLQGQKGATGPTGPAGATGVTGPEGAEGSPWTVDGTLPSEATLTGAWSFANQPVGQVIEIPISFSIPLAASMAVAQTHEVYSGETAPSACAGGTIENPQAEPGHLCVYGKFVGADFAASASEDSIPTFSRPGATLGTAGVGVAGTVLQFMGEPGAWGRGTWAVTAP